jgi:hypothetical protein
MDSFDRAVLAAPHCVISDSIFGLQHVHDGAHQFRGCYASLAEVGCMNHLVKCMPCASLAQIQCALIGYLDLVGAGHTMDSEHVRIADNLGVLVIGWALSDLRFYDQGSCKYMLSGKLRDDLIAVAKLLRFHSKVIWVIGGHAETYMAWASHSATRKQKFVTC